MITDFLLLVGQLPDWYDESRHDIRLESEIWQYVSKRFVVALGMRIKIEYVYTGDHRLMAYDDTGEVAIDQTIDLSEMFERIENQQGE
jgi:hypothetical protein